MKDRYNREISYLRISITDACNLRCMYCVGDEPSPKTLEISRQEILRIAEASVECGIKKIRITGGEPLLHKDVVDICRDLKRIPGLLELTMTTNGLLLERYALQLKDAGLDRVNISLDTLCEETFQKITGKNEFNKVRNGIEAAKKANLLPIKINCVLLSGINEEELRAFVDLTRQESIEVRFIELMPIGNMKNYEKQSFLSGEDVLKRVKNLYPVMDSGVAKMYRLDGGKGMVGIISPVSRHFCPSCNRIRVTCDAKLMPCLHAKEEINLRGLSKHELIMTIKQAIYQKPMEHGDFLSGENSMTNRRMNEIGG